MSTRSYIVITRLTPSVTCLLDSVAPEMLSMSRPSFNGDAPSLPTNCLTPRRVLHLGAVGLEVFEDLDLLDLARRIDPDRVGDELVLAHDLVDDEPAAAGHLPDAASVERQADRRRVVQLVLLGAAVRTTG